MRSAALMTIVTATLLLTSCAAAESESPGLTLVETKAQAQLLRNAAAERVPAAAVTTVVEAGDESSECGDGDPYLQWNSTVSLELTEDAALQIEELYAGVISSYVSEGWVSARPQGVSTRVVNTGAFSEVLVATQGDNVILVTVSGPCVLTDGADSAEVARLHGDG